METIQNKKEIHICDYGCKKEAKYQFKNGKWCCSKNCAKCSSVKDRNWRDKPPEVRLKISIKVKEANKRPDVIEKIKNRKPRKLTEEETKVKTKRQEDTRLRNGTNLSEIHKKLWRNSEHREKQLKSLSKTWNDPKRNKKISVARILYFKNNPGISSGENSSMFGKHHDEQWKLNNSIRMIKLWKDENYKSKVIISMIESWKNENRIQKQKDFMNEKVKDPVYIETLRQSSLKNWKDPVYVKKIKKTNSPNKQEKKLIKILEELNLDYKFSGNFDFMIDGKNPDFLNHSKNKIIEHFGIWYHGEMHRSKKFKDFKNNEEHAQDRIDHFAKNGYQTLIIWEDELKDKEKLIKKILKFDQEDF